MVFEIYLFRPVQGSLDGGERANIFGGSMGGGANIFQGSMRGEGGKYFIFMHQNIREEGQNDNYQYLTARLYKNGSFYTEGQRAFGGNNLAANFNNTASFGIIMELAASDYLEFYIKVYNSTFHRG